MKLWCADFDLDPDSEQIGLGVPCPCGEGTILLMDYAIKVIGCGENPGGRLKRHRFPRKWHEVSYNLNKGTRE